MKFLRKHSKRAAVLVVLALMLCMILAIGAFAEGESGSAAISSAVTTALATTQGDIMSMIAAIVPYALAIVGAILVVTIGIKVFKRISGR